MWVGSCKHVSSVNRAGIAVNRQIVHFHAFLFDFFPASLFLLRWATPGAAGDGAGRGGSAVLHRPGLLYRDDGMDWVCSGSLALSGLASDRFARRLTLVLVLVQVLSAFMGPPIIRCGFGASTRYPEAAVGIPGLRAGRAPGLGAFVSGIWGMASLWSYF